MNKQPANHSIQVLNVPTMPLTSISLIEASAGTGKTFTITSLYLRLVLGHQCEPLSPENILVVTFTRAATEELRSRIRERLRSAYLALNNQAVDPLIADIRSDLEDIEQAKQRLKDARQLMDLAAIFTIHGYAQRMLRQNAVESGINGEFELILDESELLEQAIQDVWRGKVYPLTGFALQLVLENWSTPQQLLSSLRSLIYKQADFHLGVKAGEVNEAYDHFTTRMQKFDEVWTTQSLEFMSAIENNPKPNGTFTKGMGKKQGNINAYLHDSRSVKLKDVVAALQSFTQSGLKKSVNKGGEPIEHVISSHCQAFLMALEDFEAAKVYAVRQKRVELLQSLRVRLEYLKQKQQVLSTDDLLFQLNSALNGRNQETLLQQIRQQYPVAMVDEFQDTDNDQYQVFHKVYSSELKAAETHQALFMIGDPKQAIYKFRGADIFTYIQAKQKVDGQYTLDTNYRSSLDMVNGVNCIFTQHNRPFIYDDSIPFLEVKANDTALPLSLNKQTQRALSWVYVKDEAITNKEGLNQACAESCAEKISQLLSGAQKGDANIGDKQLTAGDIAVLVRSGMQATRIKHSLSKRGISCVYVGRESIFDCEEAAALLALLQAVHELSERQFRNAIAYPVWSLSLGELNYLSQDESAWEAQLEQLYECHDVWQKQGVMAMVMHWLHSRTLPQTWLDNLEGERRLTNFMHLAELLQNSSTEVQGMQGLITWFTHQLFQSISDNDQKQLRLESDANLVQIVTIHKSKGLEYPVVFLPFSWDGKESSDELFFDESRNSNVCDMVGDYQEQRIQEGLAEEVRLLYVGLTRAASKCYVTLPEITANSRIDSSLALSALSYVLMGADNKEEPRLPLLEKLQTSLPDSFDIEKSLDSVSIFKEVQTEQTLEARQFNGQIKRDWQLSSFSGLIRHLHAPVAPRFQMDDDQHSEVAVNVGEIDPQFAFPRGPNEGNFLHTLLEEVDFSQLPDDIDDIINTLMARFGISEEHAHVVQPWLETILSAPMSQHGATPLSLSDLTMDLKKVEMEFYFPVERLKASDFNQLLSRYPCISQVGHALNFSELKGMLKGFIDLTFEWKGQYFILDYKSNHLGNDYSDYLKPQLEHAMSEHRYDVQLVIYTLALHRLLSLRIPDYDYDTHMGGGYYLFLRGLQVDNTETGQFYCKPNKQLILGLDGLLKGQPLEDVLNSEPEQGSLL